MSVLVCGILPSIHAAYSKNAVPFHTSLTALYRKIERLETPIGAAMVRMSAERLGAVTTAMGGARTPFLPGYRTKILDGNHLAKTEHRIAVLRTMRAVALPGQALVVFDPELMLAIDVVLCEDGYAQARSLLAQFVETVAARVYRSHSGTFAPPAPPSGSPERKKIRETSARSTLHCKSVGRRKAQGRSPPAWG